MTGDDLTRFDTEPAAVAVERAWLETSANHPGWHTQRQDVVRAAMPTLARALDRLTTRGGDTDA